MVARLPNPNTPQFPQFPPQGGPCWPGGGPILDRPFPFPGQGGGQQCPGHHRHHKHHHQHGGGGPMPMDPLSFLGGASGGARGGGFLV